MTKIYCSDCSTNFIDIPDEALSPDFRFRCRECLPKGNAVGARRLNTAYDPRFARARRPQGTPTRSPRPSEWSNGFSWGDLVARGFHIDGRSPKTMKPGPEWCYSEAFIGKLLIGRTAEERIKALVVMVGRWRRGLMFKEIAIETGIPPAEARKILSSIRVQGNRLWKKKQRAEAKLKRQRELSVKAKELADQGFSVRRAAKIMGVSVGHASELRRAA